MKVQLAKSVAELPPHTGEWKTDHPVLKSILQEITDQARREYHPCMGRFNAILVERLRQLPGLQILSLDPEEPHPDPGLGVTP